MSKTDIPTLVKNDPWLSPYTEEIKNRIERFKQRRKDIEKRYGSLSAFASAYQEMGLNYDAKKGGWWYREWAPGARALSLIGEFNAWDKTKHPLTKEKDGIWEIFIDSKSTQINHLDAVKVHITDANGVERDRIPAYIKYATQDPKTYDFTGRVLNPPKAYKWSDKKFDLEGINENPYIYECHIGMAQEEAGVGSYVDFKEKILPKVKEQGYNVIQFMAIQEHPYYGSFGYHVSNFFAVSSRFGTPDEFRALVDAAHQMGIAVIIDIVHSHAVKNISEGLNEFDGTDDQYFHPGGKGTHDLWDSKLFNYGKEEVLRFLLSNVKYWVEEFHVDGYRYDGVTSMLYFHHGNMVSFDHYDRYFNEVDWDVLTYFQLANSLIKEIKPGSIVIAEDMSGMPGLCRPVKEGGLGFDFRLAMGIPDYWIKLLKHKPDEEWNIFEMWETLTNRRFGERTIAYAESHDQALVGDKSLAFWLMDKEMYTHMHVSKDSLIIDRGIALHKLIRLFTLALGGEGWLNFIGNEFGHPEWVDFPREGNNWSYHYARRQWNLQESDELKYKFLYEFGKQMVKVAKDNHLVSALPAKQLNMDEANKAIIFERNNLIFLFNFHPHNSIPDYRFKIPECGHYQIVLNSDNPDFGGFGRIDDKMTYPSVTLFGENFLSVYLPSRVALILKKVK